VSRNVRACAVRGYGTFAAIAAAVSMWACSGMSSSSANKLTSIAVTPANPPIAVGGTIQFTAMGTFSDGSTRSLPGASWTSSAIDVATISAAGLATGVAPGTTTITATSGGVNGATTLSVEVVPTLVSIVVGPANPSLVVGSTLQFTATGTFNDGSIKNVTGSVMWSSSAPDIASISTGGLATGAVSGVTTITASSGSINGTTSLTITQH
jgi:trimeric autotransporter adhesin